MKLLRYTSTLWQNESRILREREHDKTQASEHSKMSCVDRGYTPSTMGSFVISGRVVDQDLEDDENGGVILQGRNG